MICSTPALPCKENCGQYSSVGVHRVAFIADIEQMFRQIRVYPEDRKLQHILWRESPAVPVAEYQLSMVTYWTSCAPHLAIRVLRPLAQDEQNVFL